MSTVKYSFIENLGFLSVIGPDSKKFLQGQSSCQFNNFELGQQKKGSFSDAKGRVYSNFTAIAVEGGFLLQMSNDIIESTLSTLKKYAAFFKVKLDDESNQYKGVALQGDLTQVTALNNEELSEAKIVLNESGFYNIHDEQFAQIWSKSDLNSVLDSITEKEEANELYQNYCIEKGLPWLSKVNVGEFVAQMLNLDLIDAIDFKKGCYTGQEIIARLHYKGVSKKRLQRVAADHRLNAGDIIVNQAGKSIGLVVNASDSQALISATLNETYYLQDKLENPLKLLDLPYQF